MWKFVKDCGVNVSSGSCDVARAGLDMSVFGGAQIVEGTSPLE